MSVQFFNCFAFIHDIDIEHWSLAGFPTNTLVLSLTAAPHWPRHTCVNRSDN